MSAVSLATIRARFATEILTLSGFTQSRNPFDGYGRQPNTVAHKRFSIGITSVVARDDDRQRSSVGCMCDTEVVVRYPFRIRPKDQVTSFDEALTSAESIIKKLVPRSAPLHSDLTIRFSSIDNQLSDTGEYMSVSILFTVLHYITLT